MKYSVIAPFAPVLLGRRFSAALNPVWNSQQSCVAIEHAERKSWLRTRK